MKSEMLRCLEALDIATARGLWEAIFPHLPAPASDSDTLVVLHLARTASERLPLKLRAYSHRWLTERNFPSQLPDRLKQSAERIYPCTAAAVGISYTYRDPALKPAADLIRGAMEGAVYEADADGRLRDDAHVKARMNEARDRERKALFGRIGLFKVGAI